MTAIVPTAEPGDDRLDVLERARAGDHDAFADLVEEHEAMVFSIAVHFFNERGRAEEIAQDVFLQLYRSLASIETPSHLVFWLRQVTSRRCIDQLRRAKLRIVSIEDVHEITAGGEFRDTLFERKVRGCVAELPELQRLIL